MRTIALWLVASLCLLGCDDDDEDHCRYNQGTDQCFGSLGGTCDRDRDCWQGECCTSKDCGGGMCTLSCRDDLDCPFGMACHDDLCFYACESDADCAYRWSCEHKKTVCQAD